MIKNQQIYQQAVELRKTGASYSQINRSLSVPKSTLSGWFSKLQWSKEVIERLNAKWGLISAEKVRLMNTERLKRVEQKNGRIRKNARKEFQTLMQNPLFPIGISLYWAEGVKANSNKVGVVNSDVHMMQIVGRFYREVLHINEGKLRCEIFRYADQNEEELKKFWSEKLQLSPMQFIKTQLLPSRSTLTKRKTTHGMCNVYFSSTEVGIKISEWILLLAKRYAGVAQW